MRKIRIKDGILEIITERYLTPAQYSAFEKYPDRIRKMMDAQSNETTLAKIGVVATEDTSKMLTVTFAVKFPSSSENSFINLNEDTFVNLSEVEQKLENFTEDVIGTINSWIEDEKVIITFIPGPHKLEALKIIKEKLHIGLKEAKDCVDARQFECTEGQLEIIKPLLEKIGCSEFEKKGEQKSLNFTNASLEECREYMQKIANRIVGIKDASVLVMIANKTEDGISCHTFGDMNKHFAIMNIIERDEAE